MAGKGGVFININNYLGALNNTDLFAGFSRGELKDLLQKSGYELKRYEKDQIVHLQNETCRALDIILEGRVAVQKIDEEGNVLTINVFSAGDIIGANLIFSRDNFYPMTAIADKDTIILHLGREAIVQLGYKKPDFLINLLGIISDRALILADKIKKISHKNIREQIIDFLTYEYHLQKTKEIELNYSKKELAERFGVQRPSLSRELKKMREAGLLDFDARTVTILDLDLIRNRSGDGIISGD